MNDFGGVRGRVIDVDMNGPKVIRGVGIVAALVLAVVLLWASVAYVPAGSVGVLTIFGRVTGEVLPEGTHFVNPFKVNHTMSVRTEQIKEAASVPSNEGLIITMDTSLLFRLDASRAADVYQKLGPRYQEVVVEPNLRSAIRSVTANHSANALYSSEREQVSEQINAALTTELAKRGIIVENTLLRDIQLPQTLKASIESKQQAEQESLAMNFRLQKERQEADRKRIEAQGIRDFQQIVAQGISAQLLEWKGIEATETLAKSPNAKVVVIGGGKNGLPLILGQ
ncbi:MAG TPA: prohibitin family protein [Clostridia bacterium]|nr:prohibitin family protein [Clostridia bacterium]